MKRGQLIIVISIVLLVGVVALLGLHSGIGTQAIYEPSINVRITACESPFRPSTIKIQEKCDPSTAKKNIGKLLDKIRNCREQLPEVIDALETSRSCLTEIADDVPTYSGTECARSEPLEMDERSQLPEDASAYDSCFYQTTNYCSEVSRIWNQVKERVDYVTDHCSWPEARQAIIVRDWFISPSLTKDLPGWSKNQERGLYTYAASFCKRALEDEKPCAAKDRIESTPIVSRPDIGGYKIPAKIPVKIPVQLPFG